MNRMLKKCLVGMWAFGFVLIPTGVDAAETADVVVPFSVWRMLLPWDGEIIQFIPSPGEPGYNEWPKNQNKGPFEQHAMAEISFGWRIRAQAKDKKHEGPMRLPGFVDHGEFVRIHGGFRAHQKAGGKVFGWLVKDYFDGVFSADLYLAVVDGRFSPRIENLSVNWNDSALAKAASLVTLGLMKVVVDDLIEGFEGDYEEKTNNSFALIHGFYLKARENQEVFARLADRTRLAVRGTSIVFQIDTANPSNANVVFPPALRARAPEQKSEFGAVPAFSEKIDVTGDTCKPIYLARPRFSAAATDLGKRFLGGTGKGLFEVRGVVDDSGRLIVESVVKGLEIGFGSAEAVFEAIDATEFSPSAEHCQVRIVYEVK